MTQIGMNVLSNRIPQLIFVSFSLLPFALIFLHIHTRVSLVFSGRPPYPDVNNWDMALYLKQGRRLPEPDTCFPFLYAIMLRCWDMDPDKRPTFSELVETIEYETAKAEMQSWANRKVDLHVTYVNVPRGSYYNASESDDREFQIQRQRSESTAGAAAAASVVATTSKDGEEEMFDASSGPESGFGSSSNRSTAIFKKPASDPSSADVADC